MEQRSFIPQLSLKERDRRYARMRELMAEKELRCLVVEDPVNIRYLTQITGGIAYIIFPEKGEPLCSLSHNYLGAYPMERYFSWVSQFQPRKSRLWHESAAVTIEELGLGKSRIGIVGLGGSHLSEGTITYQSFTGLREALPGATLVAARDVLDEARAIKSPEEIHFIEEAARIGDIAVRTLITGARPGKREDILYAEVIHSMLMNGAEFPVHLLWESGPAPCHAAWWVTTRELAPGDIIVNEISPRYGGYWAHPHQPVAIGQVRPDYQDMFRVCLEAFWSLMEALKPGTELTEVVRIGMEPVRKAGYTWIHPPFHGLGIGRISVGQPATSEFPVAPSAGVQEFFAKPVIIQPGMVLGLEPIVASPDKKRAVPLGDTVVIEEQGPRRLSNRTLEFVVV